MESSAAPKAPEPYLRIAHPIHTVAVLIAIGVTALRAAMRADQMRSAVNLDRIRVYERTMLVECAVLDLVLLGLAFAKTPLTTVLGERWHSLGDVARDFGIGVAYSFISTIVISVLGAHTHSAQTDRAVQFLLPHGRLEMTLWIALSVTAGICEEAVYRGYLQRQFLALTKNVPAGILLSAILFGFAHSYQGFWGAIPIAMDGALLGTLAYWRKTVRPGMIAHAWKGAPLLMGMVRH